MSMPDWATDYVERASDIWGERPEREAEMLVLMEFGKLAPQISNSVAFSDFLVAWNALDEKFKSKYQNYFTGYMGEDKGLDQLREQREKLTDSIKETVIPESEKYSDLLYGLPTIVCVRFFESLSSQ